MAAPPVMEFDNEGNFIQGWGGESGPGHVRPVQFPLRAQQSVIGKAIQEDLVVANVQNQDGRGAGQKSN